MASLWERIATDAAVVGGWARRRVRHVATRESPALLRSLEGHTAYVRACAVTPDGRHVVSASDDNTLKVWDLASGRAVAAAAPSV